MFTLAWCQEHKRLMMQGDASPFTVKMTSEMRKVPQANMEEIGNTETI